MQRSEGEGLRWTRRVQRGSRVTRAACLLSVFIAAAFVAVACNETPTQRQIVASGHPAYICYDGGGQCVCFPGTYGTWPNCSSPPTVTGDTAQVFCTPRALTRGDTIACAFYVGNNRPFLIYTRWAQNLYAIDSTPEFSITDTIDTVVSAGGTYYWHGQVAKSAAVSATIFLLDSLGHKAKQLPTKIDTFIVQSRTSWTQYSVARLPLQFDSVLPKIMTEYPSRIKPGTDSQSTVVGAFRGLALGLADSIRKDTSHAQPIVGGPNTGLTFFVTEPPFLDSTETWLHPALYGGLGHFLAAMWYSDQNGQPFVLADSVKVGDSTQYVSTTLTACNAQGVARLLVLDSLHEGAGGAVAGVSSHYANLVNVLASSHLAAGVEATVVHGDRGDLRVQVSIGPLLKFADQLHTVDSTLEATDYPRIFGHTPRAGQVATDSGAIGCFIHSYNRRW